jgi:deoxyribodipyrimidine photo-lyase
LGVSAPVILWFRNDLRLTDSAALTAAAATGSPVICAFVLDDAACGAWKAGGASRWWLHHSLTALDAALRKAGNRLICRTGRAVNVIAELADEAGARAVYLSRRYEPWAVAEETALSDLLSARAIDVRRFGGALLVEPEVVRTGQGTPFKVFTPFYRAVLKELAVASPRPAPETIPAPKTLPRSKSIEDLGLRPLTPDWAAGLRETWLPGEAGAVAALDRFIAEAMAGYPEGRDRPAAVGTSRLSPHLHFGEIGPRQILARLHVGEGQAGAEAFVRELVWRDFCAHLLFHWPEIPDRPFRPEYADFPWRSDPVALRAWQRGQTGYPMVDAGMRELWRTGWMHNRVRMITASFLVKHLLVPWQDGEAWFWDTLVDADLASNAANWQWVAGSGADAAPYFRIFNPVTQGEKFDPRGDYVRRWIPEIAALPDKYIHRPWTAPDDALRHAGIDLGTTYPRPIVDHAASRARALLAFETFRRGGEGAR